VVAYIESSSAGQEADPSQLAALNEAVHERFEAADGVVTMTTDAGCFIAQQPMH